MLTPTQAIKKALETTRNEVGMCDKWVASYFGYSSSGYATASSHWAAIPSTQRHPGDVNPPAGSLVFWGGGAGHVALSVGNGQVVSTDYPRSGITSQTSISSITNGWGKSYLGWSVPVFQGQVSQASFPATSALSLPGPLGSILGTSNFNILDLLGVEFGGNIKDILQRASLVVLGAILIIAGIANIQKTRLKAIISGPKEAKETVKKTAAAQTEAPEEKVEETKKETVRTVRSRGEFHTARASGYEGPIRHEYPTNTLDSAIEGAEGL